MYKARFYFPAVIQHLLVPDSYYRAHLRNLFESLSQKELRALARRVGRYIQLDSTFSAAQDSATLQQLSFRQRSAYYYDLRSLMRYFPPSLRFHHLFGDVVHVPANPTFVKCRPIDAQNHNSVLLKLNSVRHYRVLTDPLPFQQKIPRLVWRGQAHRPWRQVLAEQYWDHPDCDIGQVNKPAADQSPSVQKNRMSLSEQLRYQFILSVEGNDIATNLKWIAQSNSLCFMPRPKFESWFLENDLEPGVHYVQIQDDFSDIPEKIEHYVSNPTEAQHIIHNLQDYHQAFTNARTELLTGLLTAARYFHLSGQLDLELFPESVRPCILNG